MPDEMIKDAARRMGKSLESLQQELARIRTGRAHPGLLEHVSLDYYGSEVPLHQLASISVADARTLHVNPFDRNIMQSIEKAILNSDLGLNPMTSGELIRIPLPPLTEERRRELIKVVRAEAEKAKVAVRNIRRDANNALKARVKDRTVSEDEARRAEERVQKQTDAHISDIDKLLATKEAELLEI